MRSGLRSVRWTTACALAICMAVGLAPVKGATPEEVRASIEAGIEWLVSLQGPDGAWVDEWGGQAVSPTGFAVMKLAERAFEEGYDSPFDPAYRHSAAIEAALSYLFRSAVLEPIVPQPAGDPDRDGDGQGVCFGNLGRIYDTSVCLMAIVSTRAPGRIVSAPGSLVDGWTYKDVVDDTVDFMSFAQIDSPPGRGGWRYWGNDGDADNSNTGYAVLGLAYAATPLFGFNSIVPPFVKSELDFWIEYIQTDGGPDDGGSGYAAPGNWVNILKTGNLVFEMTFAGDPPSAPRMQRALDYLGRRWYEPSTDPGWMGPPPHYQAMYCVMKGLTYAGIETISVGGTDVNWYDEFASAIVTTQLPDGSWPGDNWGGQVLATEWALLTLEAIAPPVPEPFGQWVYAGQAFDPMNLDDFVVGGTPPYAWSFEEPEHVVLEIGPGNVLTITYPAGWYGEENVLFTVTDAVGLRDDVYATFTVVGVPIVGDIPDQTAPFESFDLDDYLSGMAPEDVEWTASDPGGGWNVAIDGENVVTVTAPAGAVDPVTITFTATSIVYPSWWLGAGYEPPSDSDEATFSPNQPPDCSNAAPSVMEIWSPNHKWVEIEILGVIDPDGDPVTITITGITQDEPTDEKGDGNTCPDGDGIGTSVAKVRAERSGKGNGRVYEISFDAADGKGGVCCGTVEVCVPHDMRLGHACINDKQKYDSTQCRSGR